MPYCPTKTLSCLCSKILIILADVKGFIKFILLLFFLVLGAAGYMIYKHLSENRGNYDRKREEVFQCLHKIVERIKSEGRKGMEFAEKALEDLNVDEKIGALEEMLHDADSKVREFAAKQLEKLKGGVKEKDTADNGEDKEVKAD